MEKKPTITLVILILIMVLNGILKQHSTDQSTAKTQGCTPHCADASTFLWGCLLVVLLLRGISPTIARSRTIAWLTIRGWAICRLAIPLRRISLLLRVTISVLLLLGTVLVATIATAA